MHVFRSPWGRVESDGGPNFLDISFGDAVASQKVTRGVRTIHFEAKLAPSVTLCKADVVEHGCGVKQFRIKHQALPLPSQGAPKVDPNGVVKQQVALGVANKLRYLM